MSCFRHCQKYIHKSTKISESAIRGKLTANEVLSFAKTVRHQKVFLKICLYFVIRHSTKSQFNLCRTKSRNFLHQIFLFDSNIADCLNPYVNIRPWISNSGNWVKTYFDRTSSCQSFGLTESKFSHVISVSLEILNFSLTFRACSKSITHGT